MDKRTTIGVIIDTMDGQYQATVTEALNQEAMFGDLNLLFFSGIVHMDPTMSEGDHNSIFNLINLSLLDGVILVLSSMENHASKESIALLSSKFKGIPAVSISIPVDGAVNIMLDNRQAMRQVIDHVLSHVPIEETVYVSGPVINYEAVDRLRAYQDAWEASPNPLNEGRIYYGDFILRSGEMAVDFFLDGLGACPKAIICANDEMAIGVYMRLNQLGLRVPDDVILTGFDNIEAAQDFFPPFTTLDQHLSEMCRQAVKSLINLISGQGSPSHVWINGELKIRESCGCVLSTSHLLSQEKIEGQEGFEESYKALKTYLETERPTIQDEIYGYMGQPFMAKEIYDDFTQRLEKALLLDINEKKENYAFIHELNTMANYAIHAHHRNCMLTQLVVSYRNRLMVRINQPVLKEIMNDIFFLAEAVMGDAMRRKDRHQQYHFRHMYLMSRQVVQDLNRCLNEEDMIRILDESLQLYGITECFLVKYRRPMAFVGKTSFTIPKHVELTYGRLYEKVLQPMSFNSESMLPEAFIQRKERISHLYLALFSSSHQYGYIVFSVDAMDPLIYETIRGQVSEAFERLHNYEKRQSTEKALKHVMEELELSNELLRKQSIRDDLTGTLNRRGFYQEAEKYYEEAMKTKEKFAVIFGDIDGLKSINDQYGHDEGDFAIKKIAQILQTGFGQDVILARMSGDEFTALLCGVGEVDTLESLKSKVQDLLNQFNKAAIKPYPLAISMGYSFYEEDLVQSMDDLLKGADKNLYREKKRRKGAL